MKKYIFHFILVFNTLQKFSFYVFASWNNMCTVVHGQLVWQKLKLWKLRINWVFSNSDSSIFLLNWLCGSGRCSINDDSDEEESCKASLWETMDDFLQNFEYLSCRVQLWYLINRKMRGWVGLHAIDILPKLRDWQFIWKHSQQRKIVIYISELVCILMWVYM